MEYFYCIRYSTILPKTEQKKKVVDSKHAFKKSCSNNIVPLYTNLLFLIILSSYSQPALLLVKQSVIPTKAAFTLQLILHKIGAGA